MCLITYAPLGAATLDMATLDYSRTHMNDDGFGIAWFDYEVNDWQTMLSLRSKKLAKALARIADQTAPVIVHQRFATHGGRSFENLHPFKITEDGAGLLFHNGTISGTRAQSASRSYSYKDKDGKTLYHNARASADDISDTRAFIADELGPMLTGVGMDALMHPSVQRAVSNRIGMGNVLAICIPNNPEPVLINERRGDWVGGLFYSNDYARPTKSYGAYSGGYDTGYGECSYPAAVSAKAWENAAPSASVVKRLATSAQLTDVLTSLGLTSADFSTADGIAATVEDIEGELNEALDDGIITAADYSDAVAALDAILYDVEWDEYLDQESPERAVKRIMNSTR